MNMKSFFLLVICLIVSYCSLAQVDPHFSQYYAYPLWLNPALTGVINGDGRVAINLRSQWQTINNAYKTAGISADIKATDKIAIGINIIDQAAGTAGYNYLAAYSSVSYEITLSGSGYQNILFGFQAGLINRSFDPNSLQLDDQYNSASGFQPNLPSFEKFSINNATVLDANFGVFYLDQDPQHITNAFGGISMAHLNRPHDPFGQFSGSSSIPFKYTFQAGLKINSSKFFTLTPHLIFIQQQNNQIIAAGLNSEYQVSRSNSLILGGMYRVHDASIINAGYVFSNTTIGVSYDFNTSKLNTATSGQGGFELSLVYIFAGKMKGPSRICPRI